MPGHICPFGLKARWLLKHKGYEVEDHWLKSRAEQDAFKAAHDVTTTPQIFIEGERVGGYDDLRRFFGLRVIDAKSASYAPVVAVFAVSVAIALAIDSLAASRLVSWVTVGRFIAVVMCLLAMLKLQALDRFVTMFLGYDLVARRYVPYGYAYPFAELGAGALMLANLGSCLAIPIALVIGSIGAVSVFKAVYVEKRDLKCACVGGNSNVPLGFVSLTENLLMIAMAVGMLLR